VTPDDWLRCPDGSDHVVVYQLEGPETILGFRGTPPGARDDSPKLVI
jgi:hypothetical protein